MKHIIISLILLTMSCSTENGEKTPDKIIAWPKDTLHYGIVTAQIKGMYPVVITNDVELTQAFYTKWFNYSVVFQSSWFILLSSPGENSSMIAFMNETHPSTPPTPRATKGDGLFLTIDVADSKLLFETLKASGVRITYDLTEEAWGQKRFAVTDPNGIWIDVVEQIQPTAGWWDQYMK